MSHSFLVRVQLKQTSFSVDDFDSKTIQLIQSYYKRDFALFEYYFISAVTTHALLESVCNPYSPK